MQVFSSARFISLFFQYWRSGGASFSLSIWSQGAAMFVRFLPVTSRRWLARDVFVPHARHVYGVTNKIARHKNGGTHGRVSMTYQHQLLTNWREIQWKPALCALFHSINKGLWRFFGLGSLVTHRWTVCPQTTHRFRSHFVATTSIMLIF